MLDLWGGHRQNSHTSATNSPLLPTSTTNVLNHPHSQQARPKMIYQLIPTLVATRTMSVTVAAELTLSLSMTFYRGICNSTITKLTNFTVSDIDIDTDLAHEGLIGKAAGKGWDIHSLHRFLGYNYSGHNDTTSSLSKVELFFLWCMQNGIMVNLGFWFAHAFERAVRNNHLLILGPYSFSGLILLILLLDFFLQLLTLRNSLTLLPRML